MFLYACAFVCWCMQMYVDVLVELCLCAVCVCVCVRACVSVCVSFCSSSEVLVHVFECLNTDLFGSVYAVFVYANVCLMHLWNSDCACVVCVLCVRVCACVCGGRWCVWECGVSREGVDT